MIKRLPVGEVRWAWEKPLADRYVAHLSLSMALIQLMDDPDYIYVVEDECLPSGIVHAREIVARWRETNAAKED